MKSLASLFVVVVLIVPFQVLAQKVIIEEVQAEVQPLKDGEFQFHFEFSLPDFDQAKAESVNIDYATLEFDLIVDEVDSIEINLLEVLASGAVKDKPRENLAYNDNPVTARVSRRKAGAARVRVDITQLVDHWVHKGLDNAGLILISHRNFSESKKVLREGKVRVGERLQPSVTIFYTVLEE